MTKSDSIKLDMLRILGAKIDDYSIREIEALLGRFVRENKFRQIVTLNPEMIMAARQDPEFMSVINSSDLVLCDGTGVSMAAFFQEKKKLERVTGNDLLEKLMHLSNEMGLKVFLLGGSAFQAELAAEKLSEKFPSANVEADQAGEVDGSDGAWRMKNETLQRIQSFAPDILFVALGHGKQEKWIHDHKHLLPSVKIAVGVGGAFAFLSGHIARAPKVFRMVGLEWFWRLIIEPKRVGRIFTAVVLFPSSVIFAKLREP